MAVCRHWSKVAALQHGPMMLREVSPGSMVMAPKPGPGAQPLARWRVVMAPKPGLMQIQPAEVD